MSGPPFVVLSCGPGVSMEKESLDGNGNGLPELLAAPAERGESPVDDGDISSASLSDTPHTDAQSPPIYRNGDPQRMLAVWSRSTNSPQTKKTIERMNE